MGSSQSWPITKAHDPEGLPEELGQVISAWEVRPEAYGASASQM